MKLYRALHGNKSHQRKILGKIYFIFLKGSLDKFLSNKPVLYFIMWEISFVLLDDLAYVWKT